jgi:hypothetical protein
MVRNLRVVDDYVSLRLYIGAIGNGAAAVVLECCQVLPADPHFFTSWVVPWAFLGVDRSYRPLVFPVQN